MRVSSSVIRHLAWRLSAAHHGGQGFFARFFVNRLVACFFCCVLVCSVAVPSLSLAAEEKDSAEHSPKRIQLFGTVEFKGNLKTLKQWLTVIDENKKNPIFSPEKKLNASTTWGNWQASLEKMPPFEQIKAVNSFWNKWPYRQDKDVYGKEDYWAAPYLFIKNSGDCEDYCIVKYFTLRELGFTPEQLRIVVVMEKIRNIAHAVLVVYMNDDAYILDNLTSSVLSHTKSRNYAPQYSLNEDFRWAHVRPKQQ